MWKIIWKDVTGFPVKEESYDNFAEAREKFRFAIKDAVGSRVTELTECIDKYCKKYYSKDAPRAFEQLKNFLVKFITDPNYPLTDAECDEMDEFEDYEDEKVDFWFDKNWCLEISLKDNVKFPCGCIDTEIIEPITEHPYGFFIEDWRKQFANNRIFAHILLQDSDKYDEKEKSLAAEWKKVFKRDYN